MILYNAAYYAQGVVDGMSEILDNLDVQYTYHVHEGSESATANGCYTKAIYHSHINSCYIQCSGTANSKGGAGNAWKYTCNKCNKDYWVGSWGADFPCTEKILSCGKTSSTIDNYTLGCGKTEETIESATIIY